MNKSKLICQKRINKDIKEITNSPLEGIGIAQYNNNFMQYIINIKLQTGIYNGYCIQLLLTFNDNYPIKPPKILIFPNQELDGRYHHHIFNDYSYEKGFKKFCFDLLDNDFMNVNEEKTGWNPSYTISSLLLQVQNFLSDPDMEKSHLPNKTQIDFLIKSNENYKNIFKDSKGNDIIHTWKNPYPKMYFEKDYDNNKNNEISTNKEKEEKLQRIKENLTCFTLKLNYIDFPDILLGYPIVRLSVGKNKIELYPIPELLSYDAYINQFEKEQKLERYFDISFKSANNQFYNAWLPIYINDEHYNRNKTYILNSFSIMKFGPLGIEKYDFKPNQIFEMLPIILNKMIIGIFTNKNSLSESFIVCYFHYILLFKKLVKEFKKEFDDYIRNILNQIERNNYEINKNLIPDIGNFMMLLFFSDLKISEKMWNCLFEEIFVRQMFWIFHSSENENTVKNIIFKAIECKDSNIKISNNNTIVKKIPIEKQIMNLKDNYQYCDNKGLIDDIIEDLSKDKNIINNYNENKKENNIKENIKNYIKKGLENDFKGFIDESSEDVNKKITSLVVKKRGLSFLINGGSLEASKKNKTSGNSNNKKTTPKDKPEPYDPKDYQKFKVENLLIKIKSKNSKDFLKYAYSSQRGNQLLVITFIAKNKMDNKEFIKELKDNYGIYLNVNSFIVEMKNKLKEINSYTDLYRFIGCNLLDDLSEMEYIIQSYKKAKDKKYIRPYINNNSNSENLRNTSSFFTRGRGRGGGRGIGGGRVYCSICGEYH